MIEERERYERAFQQFQMTEPAWEILVDRRDRRRRNQRIAAGVVGIAVFVAAVWVVTTGGSFNRTQQPAVRPTPTPEPSLTAPGTAYLIDLNTGEMTPLPESIAVGGGYAVSPDGTMVAYISGVDAAGMGQVFIASLDGTDVQQMTPDQRLVGAPEWSPDGAAIAYVALGDGDVTNIFLLDLATGETSQVTHEKPTTLGADYPQFSPDGASIVYEVNRGGDVDVRMVPVTGGKSVLLVRGAALGTPSPDGSTLAMGCGRRLGGGICIAHADGTHQRVLVSGGAYVPKWSPDSTRIAYNDADNKILVVDVATGETTLVAEVGGPPDFGLNWSPDGARIASTNHNTGEVKVVDVATGETTFVAEGIWYEWLDDHTLIIEPVPR